MATVNQQLDDDARAAGYGVRYEPPYRVFHRPAVADSNEVWLLRTDDGAFSRAFETNASGAVQQEFASMATVRTNLGL